MGEKNHAELTTSTSDAFPIQKESNIQNTYTGGHQIHNLNRIRSDVFCFQAFSLLDLNDDLPLKSTSLHSSSALVLERNYPLLPFLFQTKRLHQRPV